MWDTNTPDLLVICTIILLGPILTERKILGNSLWSFKFKSFLLTFQINKVLIFKMSFPAKAILDSVFQRRKPSESFKSFKGLFLLENPFKQTLRQASLSAKTAFENF